MKAPSLELPSKEVLLKLYRDLLTARRGEAEIFAIQSKATGRGSGHRGPGEEAIPIAILNNLTETDCFHPNFRTYFCHFAKPGFDLKDVIAEKLGKLSEHPLIFSPELGAMGTSGTLGEPAVRYLGAALASVIQKTGDVTVFIQGDGASNRAPTHEAMAVAAAWQLPIIFVIQNNKYGMGTFWRKSYNIDDLSVRGAGYGMPHETVDGNDMLAMYLVAKRHIDRCRAGGGPSLICADTWRLRAHYEGDAQIYRPKGEGQEWHKYDPLPRYEKQLRELGILSQEDVDRIETEIEEEIRTAIEEVESMPEMSFFEAFKARAIDGL